MNVNVGSTAKPSAPYDFIFNTAETVTHHVLGNRFIRNPQVTPAISTARNRSQAREKD